MSSIAVELDGAVRLRARHRCEYCHSLQAHYAERFQIDHIKAKQHGGRTESENLALACIECNKRKGPNLSSCDPATDESVFLFHPRQHRWNEHFAWRGATIVGLTPRGRATVALLEMNRIPRLLVREALIEEGIFPPVDDRRID